MSETAAQSRLFGTDGIRGAFGVPPLDRATVCALGFRLGEELAQATGRAPRLVLAGDTRDSTPRLAAWLAGGLAEAGAEVRWGGVLPTPAVAHLVQVLQADAAVAISASHNPHPDNGIKLIGADGFKWPVEAEARLEARLAQGAPHLPEAGLTVDPGLEERYLRDLRATLPEGAPLAGLEIVLDTANGAASHLAAKLFLAAGARPLVFHAEPDGRNINRDCGSTHPEDLADRVARTGARFGVAFDGDADRALLVDEEGQVRDGDAMLYLWASTLAARGALQPPTIVATTMSNLGLERALARHGVGLVRCGVGDRQVVETLRREGLLLGGEQSGHLVHLGLSHTGDGLLTALQLAHLVAQAGRPLSELLAGFTRFPQILLNVRVAEKRPFEELGDVQAAARRVEAALGEDGRLVLRYSGTEPLARVMIEGPDQGHIEALAAELAASIRGALGA